MVIIIITAISMFFQRHITENSWCISRGTWLNSTLEVINSWCDCCNHHCHEHQYLLQALWRRVVWRVWVSSTWWARMCGHWCCVALLCRAASSPTVHKLSATPGLLSTLAPPPFTPWWTQREESAVSAARTAVTCIALCCITLVLFHLLHSVLCFGFSFPVLHILHFK